MRRLLLQASYLWSKHLDESTAGKEAIKPLQHELLNADHRSILVQRGSERHTIVYQLQPDGQDRDDSVIILKVGNTNTVESRYLELGYLEFCEVRSVYLNQKYILIAFSNHNLALGTFLQVQITRSAN